MRKVATSVSDSLRLKAEEMLKSKPSKEDSKLLEADTLKLMHEVKVYQIELELQQEELMWAEDHERAEAAKLAKEKYAELFDSIPSGYFTLSKEGKIIELNRSGADMLGLEYLHLINNLFGAFVTTDTKPIFDLFLRNVFASKGKESCEVTLSVSGKLPVYVYISGHTTEKGEHCLITVNDISEQKRVQEELELKNAQLVKLNAEKDKFFSIIAHDLRSPFNGLLGLTEILTEGLRNMTIEQIHDIALLIKSSASNLYRLLDNLLEWSSMQRGLTTFNPAPFLLMPKISESMVLVTETANKKEITIIYDIPENVEVFADGNMFGSIIRNLATNAVKFTPKGGNITVSAKSHPDRSVEISIRDTGIGMNKKMIDDLFRLDINTNRRGTEDEFSTGLGLMICKDLIEKAGGKLWIESEIGIGSAFCFSIPSNG